VHKPRAPRRATDRLPGPSPTPEQPVEALALLLIGGLLLLGVAAAVLSRRAGLPVLVGFLALGMLLGSDGPGGLAFDDAELARTVGIVGLVAILWEGGLTTAWRDMRPVVFPATVLATAGVGITAAVVGLGAYALFDLTMLEAMLLGAVVGSTDAAAVFSTLRVTTLRRRLGAVLEVESGSNDPMAVALTLGLIAWITTPGYGGADLALELVRLLGVGLVLGLVLGVAASWAMRRLPSGLGPFVPVVSLAFAAISFGLPELVGGSGFLTVFIVALFVGNTISPFRRSLASFHEGLAWLAQIVLFVVLGLLVFPSELTSVILPGVALTAVLVVLARPAAVWLCTLGQGFRTRERALLGFAGLRGAVPIVLGTFVLSNDVAGSGTIFNAVFFVVLLSAAIQGPALEPLARRLGVAGEIVPLYRPPLDVAPVGGADVLEYVVEARDAADGRRVRELGLPRTALLAVILRGSEAIPPRGSTRVQAGDRLYVITRAESLSAVETLIDGWRDGPGSPPQSAPDGPASS
jgi:potassium/hydrogen antiporter